MAKYSKWAAIIVVSHLGYQIRISRGRNGFGVHKDSLKNAQLLWLTPDDSDNARTELMPWILDLPRHADYTGYQTPQPEKPKLLAAGTKVVAKGYNVQNFDYPAYGKIVAVCAGGSPYLVTFYGYCINGKHEESTHGLYCAANQVEAI